MFRPAVTNSWFLARIALFLVSLPIAVSFAAAQQDSPKSILATEKLQEIAHGIWGLEEELRLQEIAAELPKLREQLIVIERRLSVQVQTNRQLWQQQGTTILGLEASLAKLPSSDPKRLELASQIKLLRSQTIEPDKLPRVPAVQQQIIEFTELRQAISLALLESSAHLTMLSTRYEELSQNPAVSDALAQQSANAKLGPIRPLESHRKRLSDYEKLVFTAAVPIYLQSGRLRVGAIIDERLPVTFTYQQGSGDQATLITSSIAEAAGAMLDQNTAAMKIEVAPKRTALVREATLTSLRIGRLQLSQVRVLVLPPECEDLGCILSRATLTGHSVKIERDLLRMTIDGGP